MDATLRDYHLRPPTRGRSCSRLDSYLDTSEINNSRATSCRRTSTPSEAVRKAMQVLEETYRQHSSLKSDRWSRSADQGSIYSGPIRGRRSPSPVRSRSPSPIRRSHSPTSWTSSRMLAIERDNFQDALDDSESRREILLKKLADAQKTMELQNERLRDGEMDVSECKATIRLLQQVQQELETKTQFLQKERQTFVNKSRTDAEEKEVQKRKIEEVSREANRLRCQLDLMLSDKQQHHVTLEHLHKTIHDLKNQLKSNSELQSSTASELDTEKERLVVSKQKCELLEKEKTQALTELQKNQNSQQALINRNNDLNKRNNRCQADLQDLSQRYDKMSHELGHSREELNMCRDKIKKQSKDLNELRKRHEEVHIDRERALKYNGELEKTVESIKEINHSLKQAKSVCEDDLTSLHADLAKTRLELSKLSEENRSNYEQLKESRKNCKQLTKEVLTLRPEVEDLTRKLKEMEGSRSIDVKKISLLEAQKSQLNCEKEDALTKLSSLQESYENLESHHHEEMKRLSKENKNLRQEKDKASSQCRDAQAQFSRISEELESTNKHTQAQLDHWRQACSKLTSLVEQKDEDLRECATQRREAEENVALAEAQQKTLEIQLTEARISEEELVHLRNEQKRLSQECVENQQMITVLEMQRDILAKSPTKSSSTENISKAQIEKLQAELSLMKTKLNRAENEKEALNTSNIAPDTSADVTKLKGMNQILAEQLANVRQEAETLQGLLDEKSRIHERDVRQVEREKQQLDLRLASMADEMNALKSNQTRKANENNSEVKTLRAENLWLKQDVEEKGQQVTILEGKCVILENAKKRAEDRVNILEATLEDAKEAKISRFSPIKDRDENQSGNLRIQTAKLEATEAENAILRMEAKEMKNLKSSQQTIIDALKKQLEKQSMASGDSDSSGSGSRDIKSLRRDLQRAREDLALKEKQLSDLKKKLLESQRLEQKVRQERDELQGKTIIMESLNDSSQDLLKELEEVRKDKSNLEKQLNNFLTSKTSQTPPSSLSLAEDLDKELERQYHTVCERNQWLEERIVSLQREIELVRDQNSLLQEQRNTAEREAARLRDDLKGLRISSKGSKRQSEVENIHLQHSNAEKMQKIVDLERDLTEKKQLIQVMKKEIESLQKKSDKGKISSFMKKLRRNSDSSSRDHTRSSTFGSYTFNPSSESDKTSSKRSGFGSAPTTLETGYSSISFNASPKRSNSPPQRASSAGAYPKISKSSPKSPKSNRTPLSPLSPSLTFVSAIDDGSTGVTPSTGKRSGQRSRESRRSMSATRVSFDESSDQEADVFSPSSTLGGKSLSRDSSEKQDSSEVEGEFFTDDYVQADQRALKIQSSKPPSPDVNEPHPVELGGLPSPTSSPSLPSPSTAGKRNNLVYELADSVNYDEEASTSGSEDIELIGKNPGRYPPPIRVIPTDDQLVRLKAPSSSEDHSPSRPRSQPTFKEMPLSPVATSTKKKHSSLI